jgi:hypothetical protein
LLIVPGALLLLACCGRQSGMTSLAGERAVISLPMVPDEA